jgi:hypothetical protein
MLQHSRGYRRFTLDRMLNASVQTGMSLLLPNAQMHVLEMVCFDTGATICLVDEGTAQTMQWQYRPTEIKLVLANNSKGGVVGITEPAWALFAAGTQHEAKAMFLALVVRGAGKMFQLLVGKDLLYAVDAYVKPHAQSINYRTATGRRHELPIEGYSPSPAEQAALVSLRAITADFDSTAFACVSVADLPAENPVTEHYYTQQQIQQLASMLSHTHQQVLDIEQNVLALTRAGLTVPYPPVAAKGLSVQLVVVNEQVKLHIYYEPEFIIQGLSYDDSDTTSSTTELFMIEDLGSDCNELPALETNRSSAGEDYSFSTLDEVLHYAVEDDDTSTGSGNIHTSSSSSSSSGEDTDSDIPQWRPQMTQEETTRLVDQYLELTKTTDSQRLYLQLSVGESGGEERVAVNLYYGKDYTADLTDSEEEGGVASGLARAAGRSKQYMQASAVPPEFAYHVNPPAAPQNAAALLQEMGVAPPHWYYRGFAYVAAMLTFIFTTFCVLLKDLISTYIIRVEDAYMLLNWHLPKYWSWWCAFCNPPPPFQDPGSTRTRPRTRKQGTYHWTYRLHVRLKLRKPVTASLKRRCRRYNLAVREHNTAATKAAAGQTITLVSKGVGSKFLLPLFLLVVVCMVATTVATPSILEGHRVFSNSLAAWELSHLAGWRFRPGFSL